MVGSNIRELEIILENLKNITFGDKIENIEPYYIYTKILDKDTEELALVIPYTPAGRNNLTSMFLVTMDGEKINFV